MCGRRRGQRAYRGPLVVVLGKLAYDKYQKRKAEKSIAAAQSRELPSPEVRSYMANEEIVEKASINPPSYDEIVVNQASVPYPNFDANEKAFDWTMAKGAIDEVAYTFEEDRGYGVANGMNQPNMLMSVQAPRKGGCPSRCQNQHQNRCQQKKAERAARKAEKLAA